MAATTDKGGPEARERAFAMLADLIARGGATSFLRPPVVPGDAAFPDPWAASKAGVELLLRRLAWHAELDVAVEVDDHRVGAPPTERKPATRLELVDVRDKTARFLLGFIGADDVVGTLALEIGTAYAVMNRVEDVDPYRSADAAVHAVESDADHVRGAVAAVYRGLGVLVANAAYQQYVAPGQFNGIYVPHEYDVIVAGVVPMSTLAYLLAVQLVIRGDRELPAGLSQSQRDEVSGFMKALAGDRGLLCERLGIEVAAADDAPRERDAATAFADVGDVSEPAPRKNAFRWQTNRGGVGFVAGTLLGIGLSLVASRGLMPIAAVGGATLGHVAGRRVRTPRCSACATVVATGATVCPACGAALRGDIAALSDRLDAEERLEQDRETAR